MSTERLDEEFEYEGRLVFNGIYSTTILDSGFEFDEIVSKELTDFSEGNIESTGRGYRSIPFQKMVSSEPRVGDQIEDFLEKINALQYREEIWEYHEVEVDGEVEEAPVKTGESSFDAFWAKPNYLFVRGKKTEADQAGELLSGTLKEYLDIREIEFSPDFLLWLFSKEKNSEVLPGPLSVNMLTDARVESDEPDLFGQQGQVADSIDVTKSTPVLMGVLRQMGIIQLEGVFSISGVFLRVRISSEGRIHVLADHAIKGSPDIERMAVSIAFLKEFIDLFDQWQRMESERKYPPEQFFEDIYKECKRQGVEIQFSIDDVIREYRQKGGPEEYNQYQSGIDEFSD
ncbi:hypothetical protein G6M89_07150 [Natronolimnobius sp. AArcel1]|uniref:hypothetical protein n=1 Tax=Natronolimnobius sp. AArcel1 TaxID=1679093 RepID=UPI0013EC1C4B|nr:hypothetical protein [Natronolimnobius sp. AArcel1]NGM68786.1 hypothetical protein [Natronolimnobius sp. AArcel1]